MGLPPLEKISEFWKRYDRLADITDGKMTSDLSENLDVLLIFAALFSAINTAFISLTMPALSSDPLAETNTLLRLLIKADNSTLALADPPAFSPSSNSVIANCLLYASLSCSLLAAMGAMMAKEWLQSFDRTGQTGPLEEQGQFRQRKYDGVQRWHLGSITQSLPNLLLLSVMLFFAGVCLFLLAVNKVVAIVVITIFGGGAVLCGVTIVMGATSPLCPYQSAASRALRRTGFLFSVQWWRHLLRIVIDLAVTKPSQFISKVPNVVRHSLRTVSTDLELTRSIPALTTLREACTPEEVETAQAASWLLGTTSNRGDQIAAAQFICTLNKTACAFAFEVSGTWRSLVSRTHEAFDIWHSQPNARNQEIAELFGLASCHVLLQVSNDAVKSKDLTDLLLDQSGSFGGTFLQALHFALARYPCRVPEDEEYILHVAFLSTILNRGADIAQYQWHKLSQFFVVGRAHDEADGLLGLWAIHICDMGSGRSRASQSYALDNLMGVGENKALELFHSEPDNAVQAVEGLILSFIDPLASSDSRETSLELAELSIEAVFALHDLIILRKPCANASSVPQDSQSGQLLDGHLIDAIVGIMLDDFGSPASLVRMEELRGQLRGLRTQLRDIRRDRDQREGDRNRDREEREEREWERAWERERERELEERERELDDMDLEQTQAQGRFGAGALALKPQLKPQLALMRASRLSVESCLIRILLRAWKRTPVAQLDRSASHKIFTSSCQLWARLEATVDLTKNGIKVGNTGELLAGFDNQDELLTSNDLEMIVEFIEYLQKDREKSAFIVRNADVGINRLYVHLDRREDWDYELYSFREPRTLCSRSINTENEMAF
ncbi:hypothetical protein FRC05_008367 [Tulasnella sp. 425]|nr:hypothetical protein FRC05_008367 [Tulasnella sp. 425]